MLALSTERKRHASTRPEYLACGGGSGRNSVGNCCSGSPGSFPITLRRIRFPVEADHPAPAQATHLKNAPQMRRGGQRGGRPRSQSRTEPAATSYRGRAEVRELASEARRRQFPALRERDAAKPGCRRRIPPGFMRMRRCRSTSKPDGPVSTSSLSGLRRPTRHRRRRHRRQGRSSTSRPRRAHCRR